MTQIRLEYFILFFCGSTIADHVPVLIWGSHIESVYYQINRKFDLELKFIYSIRYEPAFALKFHCRDDFIDAVSSMTTDDTVTLVITEDVVS